MKTMRDGELNFRQVGFAYPEREGEARLAPEIAEGNEARSLTQAERRARPPKVVAALPCNLV